MLHAYSAKFQHVELTYGYGTGKSYKKAKEIGLIVKLECY